MNRRGFTYIELVMVIVLIAIIAVFVATNLGNITTIDAGAFTDKLRADIRYAQDLAMTQNRRYRVYFNGSPAPAAGYAVVYDSSAAKNWSSFGFAPDPVGSGNLNVTLNTGQYAGITVTTPTGGFVQFDSMGIPYNSAGILTAVLTISILPSGSVSISPQTGAVN